MPPTALSFNGVTLRYLNEKVADFERGLEEKRVQLAQRIIDEVLGRVRKRAELGFRDLTDTIYYDAEAPFLVFRERNLLVDGAVLEKAQKMLRSMFPQIALQSTFTRSRRVNNKLVDGRFSLVSINQCTWPEEEEEEEEEEEDAQEPNAKCRKLEDRTSLRGKCGICLEEKKLLAALVPCGHTLCCKCITGYEAGGAACPMCKEEVTGTQGVYAET